MIEMSNTDYFQMKLKTLLSDERAQQSRFHRQDNRLCLKYKEKTIIIEDASPPISTARSNLIFELTARFLNRKKLQTC